MMKLGGSRNFFKSVTQIASSTSPRLYPKRKLASMHSHHRVGIRPFLGPEEREERHEGESLEPHCFKRLLFVVHKKFWKIEMKLQWVHASSLHTSLFLPPSKNFPWMNSSMPRGSNPTPISLTLFSFKIGCKADTSFAANRQNGHPKRRKKTTTHRCVFHKSPYFTDYIKQKKNQ